MSWASLLSSGSPVYAAYCILHLPLPVHLHFTCILHSPTGRLCRPTLFSNSLFSQLVIRSSLFLKPFLLLPIRSSFLPCASLLPTPTRPKLCHPVRLSLLGTLIATSILVICNNSWQVSAIAEHAFAIPPPCVSPTAILFFA
jgi:hypothetical protein